MSNLPDASVLNLGDHIYSAQSFGDIEGTRLTLWDILEGLFKSSILYSFYLLFKAPVI